MKILSVDSSAVSCSTALLCDGVLIGEFFSNVRLTHSKTLMPMVEELLRCTKTDIENIDVFSVSEGPGSFTGIRIGISAVKGMADGVNKKCFGISTLETIAYPYFSSDYLVCSVMDARCSQVYTALFENGNRITEDNAIFISQLKDELKNYNKKIMLVGDGTQMCFDLLKDDFDNIFLAEPQFRFQRASSTAFLTEKYILSGCEPFSADKLLPKYLRLPQAERELKKKKEIQK